MARLKVLLAVDDSMLSGCLTRFVENTIQSPGAEVLVITVVQQTYPPAFEMDQGYAPELEGEQSRARERVEQIANRLRQSGFVTWTIVRLGDARECILNLSSQWGANLIVMGSNESTSIGHFIFGNVAEFVARRARCSVAIIRSTTVT